MEKVIGIIFMLCLHLLFSFVLFPVAVQRSGDRFTKGNSMWNAVVKQNTDELVG